LNKRNYRLVDVEQLIVPMLCVGTIGGYEKGDPKVAFLFSQR